MASYNREASDIDTEEKMFRKLQANVVDVVMSLIERLDKPFKSGVFGFGSPRAASIEEGSLVAACKDTKELTYFVQLLNILVYINLFNAKIKVAEADKYNSTAAFINDLKIKLSQQLVLTRRTYDIPMDNVSVEGKTIYDLKLMFADILSKTYNAFFLTPSTNGTKYGCSLLPRLDNLKTNSRSGVDKINPKGIYDTVSSLGEYPSIVKRLIPSSTVLYPKAAPDTSRLDELRARLRELQGLPAVALSFAELQERFRALIAPGSAGSGGASAGGGGGSMYGGARRKTLRAGGRRNRKVRRTTKTRNRKSHKNNRHQ